MGDEFLQQFGLRLARLLNPGLPLQTVQTAIMQVIAEARGAGSLPPALDRDRLALGDAAHIGGVAGRKMELVFVHDCRNHGCNVPHCVLCKHNPNKRCTGNFAAKYWVGDRLLAKCEGEIQVELIDTSTGERVVDDLSGYRIEACILDGNKYNTKCREAGEQRLEILDECEVLLNQKNEPLLVSASANNTSEDPRVLLKFHAGTATVPLREVKVTESSESVLAGTKRPPFRLVVRAVRENGRRVHVRPAVSEEFVVVTKRTKNLKKQEIPSLDDPIAKLNHIGKETVKKLNELKASADEVQLDLGLPIDLARITKVKDFLKLARLSEADGHLQQKLKQLLKLSKEKWDAACEHAKTAVQVDNRMRAWYMQNMSVGLLYTCTLGDVRPDCPVALIQNRKHDGADFMEVIPMEHQMPAQREQVQGTCEQAIRCWWEDAHPGWMIFTLGNKHFENLDQIIQFSRSERRIEPEVNEPDDDLDFRQRPSYPIQDQPGADSASSGRSDIHNGNRPSSRQPTSNLSGVAAPAPVRAAEQSQVGSPQASSADRPAQPQNPAQPAFDIQGGGARGPIPSFGPQSEQPGLLPSADSGNFNPFEFMTGMPFNPNAPAQPAHAAGADDQRKSPRNTQEATAAAALAAAGWPQLEGFSTSGTPSIPSNLLPLLSLNTLVKMGSLPSLGLNDGSLMPGLSSLQFPDTDQAHPHAGPSTSNALPASLAPELPAGKPPASLEFTNGKRKHSELGGDRPDIQPSRVTAGAGDQDSKQESDGTN